jgi:predicted short-subunit dehydrogenase-like oxidoreductase (DUF2520 family)
MARRVETFHAIFYGEGMTSEAPFRQIGILGTGRVAAALALGLAGASASPVLLWGRSAGRLHDLTRKVGGPVAATDLAQIMADCDVIVIAVADDAIDAVVADLALADLALADLALVGSTPFILHVSGRSGVAPLAPLAEKGALTAAVHPAMTFTGHPAHEVERMAGARFAVTASSDRALALAHRLVACLKGVAVDIPEARRALYHAALCHAANHLVTLLAGSQRALAAAGVEEPSALLAPLVRAALENGLAHGFAALSGPLLRGDGQTIGNHLAAMEQDCPELIPPYRAMALATLDELGRDDRALRAMLKG